MQAQPHFKELLPGCLVPSLELPTSCLACACGCSLQETEILQQAQDVLKRFGVKGSGVEALSRPPESKDTRVGLEEMEGGLGQQPPAGKQEGEAPQVRRRLQSYLCLLDGCMAAVQLKPAEPCQGEAWAAVLSAPPRWGSARPTGLPTLLAPLEGIQVEQVLQWVLRVLLISGLVP